jgi:hypothetical protein
MDYFETGLLKILLPLSKKILQAGGRRPRCHVGLLRVASPLNGHVGPACQCESAARAPPRKIRPGGFACFVLYPPYFATGPSQMPDSLIYPG